MKCLICDEPVGYDKILCRFCQKCEDKYTHDGCHEICQSNNPSKKKNEMDRKIENENKKQN